LLHRPIEIYPWNPDWVTVWVVLGAGLLSTLLLYFAMRQGRMEKRSTDVPGKPPIHHYAGVISSDSNPVPVFIWVLIVFVAIWVIAYDVNAAIHGLGY
jgi:hypothetical protein